MTDSDSSIFIESPTRNFYDDSIPEYQKLLLYAAGDFEIRPQVNCKPKNQVLRKSCSMHDIRYQTFRKDDYLPEDLRVILLQTIKQLMKIYQSLGPDYRIFFEKLLRYYCSEKWNFAVFGQIMSGLINFIDTTPKEILSKIFNLISMMEFQIYLMKHNEVVKGDLRKFLLKNTPLDCFTEDQKLTNKEKDEVMDLNDIDKQIASRDRTSVSVNLKDGYKFRFMRKMTTEIKMNENIMQIQGNNNVLANFAEFISDNRLIEPNEVKLNESKIFNVWTILFATHNQLEDITTKKIKYLLSEKVCCRVCDTPMSRFVFIEHVKTCYKKRKKLLKIAEISDKIITRKKQFERLRRAFKLQIMHAEDDGMQEKLDKISTEDGNHNTARLKRMTFHGGFDIGFGKQKAKSKRSVTEINEMKRDYHEMFKVGKSLRTFCNELQMEPLFTKSDILVRRNLITALKASSGKYTTGMNTLMRELNYCIDQRLAQIEKYVHLEKGNDSDKRHGSRRGATMAGCLDLSAQSLFKQSDALDSTLGFSDGNSTQASRGRPTFLQGSSGRSTFANNLDIFKVTRSDYEDSDFFEDSDNEMLFDMENILKQSKKFTSKASFELMSMEFTAGSPKKLGGVSRREQRGKVRSNQNFQEDTNTLKEDNNSNAKTSEGKRNTSNKSPAIEDENKTRNEHSSIKGESNYENLNEMEHFGSINVEMPIRNDLKMNVNTPKSGFQNTPVESNEVDSSFKLVAQRMEPKRSDSTKLNRARGGDKDMLQLKKTSKFSTDSKAQSGSKKKSRLMNQVSLEVEIEAKNFMTIPEGPELLSGAKSPTKGAPKFFKSILEKGASPQTSNKNLKSPSKKLEINWKSALKKIGKSFLTSKIAKEGNKKSKITDEKFHKEHEDVETIKANDFDLLEDIERLTATDPGEYFKSNPTLLSKINLASVKDFDYVKTLGAGAYGQVYLVRKKTTKDFFAMKVIGSDQELSRKYIKNLLNEREVFSVIKSEFCVNAVATFTYKSLVCFVMEYLPGRDLYEEVFERETLWFDSTSIRYYLAEMILGIEALHQNGIVHRDIKPANVLIDEEGHIKLTDFGLSEFRSKIGSTTKDGKTLIKGSAQYLAPEIVQGKEIGYEVDWWALGVMAYLFINEDFPFGGETIQEVMDAVVKGEIDWSNVGEDEEEGEMNPELADLIRKLLDPNPLTRLGHNGSQEIKDHPYFAKLFWDKALERKLYMFPPQDVLDLTPFQNEGIDMEAYLNIEFSHILEVTKTKTKANLPFSNRFELVRMDQFHRKNIKVRKEIKKKARELNKEETQVTNVIQDYCKREELYFYRNFNNFQIQSRGMIKPVQNKLEYNEWLKN